MHIERASRASRRTSPKAPLALRSRSTRCTPVRAEPNPEAAPLTASFSFGPIRLEVAGKRARDVLALLLVLGTVVSIVMMR